MIKQQAAFLVLSCAVTGCGTIITQAKGFPGPCKGAIVQSMPRIYSGTALDITAAVKDFPGGQIGAMLFWDIPFSLVADTVILPYTVTQQIRLGSNVCIQGSAQQGAAGEKPASASLQRFFP